MPLKEQSEKEFYLFYHIFIMKHTTTIKVATLANKAREIKSLRYSNFLSKAKNEFVSILFKSI